jgi:hypothetical protein
MHHNNALRNFGVVAALAFLSTLAGAQVVDTSSTASVNVQPALSLTLVTDPDWGRVTRPPVGTARYTLDYATSAVTNTSGDGYAFDDGAAGEFTLSGAPNGPVSFSVSIGAFSGAGVSVVASHINGTSNSGTDTLDGSGNLTLKIGGVLDIAANATLAVQTATVTVTVDYQ